MQIITFIPENNAANKLLRKKPLDRTALVALLGNESAVESLSKPDCFGNIGFASFSLTNNRAEINRTKERIAEIKKEATA